VCGVSWLANRNIISRDSVCLITDLRRYEHERNYSNLRFIPKLYSCRVPLQDCPIPALERPSTDHMSYHRMTYYSLSLSLYIRLLHACMLSTYHILLGHSISQAGLLPALFVRHYTLSPLVMQSTPRNPLGRGRGRGRRFFRRGAATAARTRTAPATPPSPMLGPSMPTDGPEVTPSPTQNTALSNVRFADFVARKKLSADLGERLRPFDRCTEVQAATFETILDGSDV